MSKLSAFDLLQVQHGRTGSFKRSAEADRGGALDRHLVCLHRLTAVDAVPLDRIGASSQRHGERISRFAGLEDEVLLARIRERVPGRAEIAARLYLDELHPLREAERVAHRVASRFEGFVGGDPQRRIERIHDVDDPEVHEDRVVAAEEGLPCPQRVAHARGVVVRVGDHDLGAVVCGRVREPSGGRWSVAWLSGEDMVVESG